MKLQGFIGPAYKLDSVNVDAQRCVNLYPEVIESGTGKDGQVAYLKATPGLEELLTVGDGPIRCVHVDSIGRILVVSGNKVYHVIDRNAWSVSILPVSYDAVDADSIGWGDLDDVFVSAGHSFYTGQKVRLTTSDTMPGGLSTGTDYWLIVINATNFQFATSYANAFVPTRVDITDGGTGTLTTTPQISSNLTALSYTSNLDFTNFYISFDDHGFATGEEVTFQTDGIYPTGLVSGISYYIIKIDDDNFRLATSPANANAGTHIQFTDPSVSGLNAVELGSLGVYGGDTVTLLTSTGSVKAASLTLAGDGSDSSTVFVDGAANYFLDNQNDTMTFGAVGRGTVAQITYDGGTYDGMEFTSTDETLAGSTLSIRVSAKPSFGTLIRVTLQASGSNHNINLNIPDGLSLTTEQLARVINSGDFTEGGITFEKHSATGDNLFDTFSVVGGSSTVIDNDTADKTDTFAEVEDGSAAYTTVPTATDIVWSDGYFIVNEGGTNKFWVSELQSFNIGALSFASSEGDPDELLALIVNKRNLYLFGERTTEIFVNTGNADFPFERVQGGFIETGIAAQYSAAKADESVIWLGRNQDGQGIVFATRGASAERISTHAIEQAIAGYADISTAVAYTYQSKGHYFYVLNFDEATWVYDLATRLWHERAYTNEGTLERHRGQYHAFDPATGRHLVGDYANNKLYFFSDSVYTDAGDAITRLRATPHISAGMKQIFYNKFQLDMETGIGLDGGVQGSDPTVMLDFSNDGGHTWSSESWTLADSGSGQIGDYKKRVIWRRLGKSRDRVFRVKITDPVKVVLIDAHIDVQAGAS